MVRRVALADVAREANVSLMTVSRVVRNKEDVSEATRTRVLEVIDRLGYRPDGIARGLVTQRTGTLGLVMPDVANPFFSDIALAVENEAYEKCYNVFLCNTGEDPRREMDMLRLLQEKRVDGIVLCSSRLDDDELSQVIEQYGAVVLINRRVSIDHAGAVLVDHEQGGHAGTMHLLDRGHREIGFLAGPTFSRGGQQRAQGYYTALKVNGISRNQNRELTCSPTIEGGYRAAGELLSNHPETTALFCYNDLVAIGALRACADLGYHVPDDVAIVGFDDIPLAGLVTPSLTTCHVTRYELGVQAATMLLRKLGNGHEPYEEITLQPDLMIRESAP